MSGSGLERPELDAARLLLSRMGISPDDLVASAPVRAPAPTFAEYVPVVFAASPPGSRRAYATHWNRAVERWGSRRLDEVTPSDIEQLVGFVKANLGERRIGRGGRSAAEHVIASLRCLYRRAVADGLIPESGNPAARVAKPRRLPNTRRAVPDSRLAEINQVVASTGDDPALDSLLVRLHTETACRRGGALALRPVDLDDEQCLVLLRETGGTVRWQPVSPTLMSYLRQHAVERGAPPTGQLLRYRTGRPITYRRYDHVWARVGQHLPWVATQQISAHWLRHTTLTWVERHFGYAIARAYAGHAEGGGSDVGATAGYVKASLQEIAEALAGLTGEAHPLSRTDG